MVRMVIDAKDVGVHAFLIQVRSLDAFKPMPGIELGEIGYVLLSSLIKRR
jgi:acyl-CoA oxidase